MVVISICECLNKIDNKIFDKSSKFLVKSDLEDIRDHREWKQADVVYRGKDDDREKLSVLSVLSQIDNVIERFYSNDFNDTEEEFDGWYELIDVSLNMNNLYEYEKK